ncbi:MAG: glycosyltransferase family 4 protein [Oligoflexia bacterium]|nr:glycosyltransferase family 4 protein [Oligoflexia bacterium]
MRILVVSHFFAEHRGGIEIVAEQLSRALVPRGFALTWAATAKSAPAGAPSEAGRISRMAMSGIDPFEARLGLPYPLWSPRSLARLWKLVGNCDAVHLHDYIYFGSICAFLFARLRRRPVLVTQHIGEIPFKSPLFRGLLALANATLGRLILGKAHQVFFVSEGVRTYFASRMRFRNPPRVVMNGLDTELFRPDPEQGQAVRRELGLEPGKPVFLFVGRFVEKKGLNLLRELARALPSAQWLFAGWGPLDPESWGLPQVKVLRGLQGAAIARLYRAADLLVLPSRGEGFPLVVQEALACGTPVLISTETAEACPEALEAQALLHEKVEGSRDDLPAWKERLETVARDPSSLSIPRDRAAAFAARRWSWERTAEIYATAYRALRLSAPGS